jgi:dihydropteroate synthase
MVGVSRKSFIGRITGSRRVRAFGGPRRPSRVAVMKGAAAVRVHDVREMREVVRVAEALDRV